MRVWIEEVVFHPDVEEKILRKHRLTTDVVRRAVLFNLDLQGSWHQHAEHGRRLYIKVDHPDDGTEIFVVLAPIDETMGRWVCKTAMKPT